jgi:ABC-2 type transport system permease protein
MTLLRLAFRAQRTGFIATVLIGGLAGLLNSVAYVQVAGTTPAERAVFAHQMEILGQQLVYLLPRPVQLDTMGGYLTWRDLSTVATIFVVWAMLAATGAGRGDEERGLTETWLASGVSRTRWLATRCVAFLGVAAASVAISLGLTAAGAAISGDALPLGSVVAQCFPVLAITLWGFGVGLVIAQLVGTRRAASVAGGIVIVALFTLNSTVRAGADPGALKWLSPFYLFDRSTPLLAGGTLDGGATAAMVAQALVLAGLAVYAFARRDVGSTLIRGRASSAPAVHRPSGDPLLRLTVLAAIDQQRGWIIGWTVAMTALGYFLSSLARTLLDSFRDIPSLQVYLSAMGIGSVVDVVGVIWFSTALLIICIFAVAQVNGWAADDAEGRLEMVLAAGVSRTRVVLERITVLLVAAGIVSVVSTAGVWAAAGTLGIAVPADRMLLAALLMLPVVFAVGAIGQALAGWRPRVAVVLIAAIAVVSYFMQEFGPVFAWPEWVQRTSLFVLYGEPVTKVDWAGTATLLGIGVTGTVFALAAMRRRDVGR